MESKLKTETLPAGGRRHGSRYLHQSAGQNICLYCSRTHNVIDPGRSFAASGTAGRGTRDSR